MFEGLQFSLRRRLLGRLILRRGAPKLRAGDQVSGEHAYYKLLLTAATTHAERRRVPQLVVPSRPGGGAAAGPLRGDGARWLPALLEPVSAHRLRPRPCVGGSQRGRGAARRLSRPAHRAARSRRLAFLLSHDSWVFISFSDNNLAIAAWRNVQLALFTGPILPTHPAMILRLRNEIVAQNPAGAFTFTSIVPNVRLPEAEAREAGVAMLRTLNTTERAAAFIIEGSGMRMSAMRTVVTVMLMGARSSHPLKVFDAASPAAAWLMREAHEQGCELPTVELSAAVESLRQQHLANVALPSAVA